MTNPGTSSERLRDRLEREATIDHARSVHLVAPRVNSPELQRVLVTLRPVIDWPTALRAAGLDGPDAWHQEDPDLWRMSGPTEECALPPLVLWGEDLRLLAERAYRDTYDKYLEPGESYEFCWPPRGALWERRHLER